MSANDQAMKEQMSIILNSKSSGSDLIAYFSRLPEKGLRRAIKVFSDIYPDKPIIGNDQLGFIEYMLSTPKIVMQDSFSNFVRSISAINYSAKQKEKLMDTTKNSISILSGSLTFEFDGFIARLLDKENLIEYVKWMVNHKDRLVLMRAADILRYEDFRSISVDAVDSLTQILQEKLQLSQPPANQ